jgi:hypothetical protein
MTRLLRDFLVAAAVLAALATAIGIYISITTVVVRNKSNESLADVKIGFTGKTLWQGDLKAGDSKWTFGMPSQDGGAVVSYVTNNVSHEIACGYVTGGPSRTSISVEILPRGAFDCEQRY